LAISISDKERNKKEETDVVGHERQNVITFYKWLGDAKV
jgi:hypothetical protein